MQFFAGYAIAVAMAMIVLSRLAAACCIIRSYEDRNASVVLHAVSDPGTLGDARCGGEQQSALAVHLLAC